MRIDNARLYSASIENGAQATGSLLVSGSMTVDGLVTATSFSGDGSSLTGVTGEWDGTRSGDAEITGSLVITQALTASGVISGSTILGERIDASVRVETSQINQASDTLDIYGATSILGSLTASIVSASGNIFGSQLYAQGGSVFTANTSSLRNVSNGLSVGSGPQFQSVTLGRVGKDMNLAGVLASDLTASVNAAISGANAVNADRFIAGTRLETPRVGGIDDNVLNIGGNQGTTFIGSVTASNGDISGSASSTGSFGSMVLTAPNGTAYLLTVNNDGHFSLTGSAV